MKEFLQSVIVLIIFIAAIPCIAFLSGQKSTPADTKKAAENMTVPIYFTKEKEVKNFSLEEYMIGSVLAQMPADFEPEALKAQAVLARTYILRRAQTEKQSPTESLCGALISDDTELYQGFFTEEKAKEFYTEDKFKGGYEKAYQKVKSAVDQVIDYTLTYKGEPVIAAFHAVSSGYTESAENAWGQDIPYLQAVKSESDKDVDGMENTVTFTAADLKETLCAVYDDIDFSPVSSAESWIKITDKTQRGYILKLEVCGKEISGRDFAEILGIASPCFTVDFSNTKFNFTSKGYGHLVGMSQYGANAMAKNGKNFKDILTYYYTDCEITEENGKSQN